MVFSFSIFAQKVEKNVTAIGGKGKVVAPAKAKYVTPQIGSKEMEIAVGVPIGRTNYDLQSNSAVAKRIIAHADGSISAVWTEDQAAAPGGTSRGTGYAYYDGSAWQYISGLGSDENAHIESTSDKTGWPAIMSNGTEEYVVNHVPSFAGFYGWKQSKGAAGTDWTSANVTGGPEGMLWPRAASYGDNYYAIGVDDYVSVQTEIDALHFYKSEDAGATWTYGGKLPDFNNYYNNGQGDVYAIDAYENYVAIVVFGLFEDTRLWKSDDYGDTWTSMAINDFPVDAYDGTAGTEIDMDADGAADTLITTDQVGDIIIDSEGTVHAVFSRMRYLDEDAGDDGAYSFFPFTDFLLYWNEDMGAGEWSDEYLGDNAFDMAVPAAVDTIGWSFDLDGSGIIWDGFVETNTSAGEWPFGDYSSSITSSSSLGIDANNNLYCVFTTVMEGDNYIKTDAQPNPQNYRGAWLTIKDATTGVWSDPVCISDNDGTNAENIFPTLARNVQDDILHIWVQWDNEPGLHIRGDEDNVTENYIIYKKVDLTPEVNISEVADMKLNVYPNPVADFATIENVEGATISIYNTLGAVVETIVSDEYTTTIDMTNYAAGTYIIKVSSENGVATTKAVKIK